MVGIPYYRFWLTKTEPQWRLWVEPSVAKTLTPSLRPPRRPVGRGGSPLGRSAAAPPLRESPHLFCPRTTGPAQVQWLGFRSPCRRHMVSIMLFAIVRTRVCTGSARLSRRVGRLLSRKRAGGRPLDTARWTGRGWFPNPKGSKYLYSRV